MENNVEGPLTALVFAHVRRSRYGSHYKASSKDDAKM
jgi:hypothetical protein